MELLILLSITIAMGGIAVYTALSERQLAPQALWTPRVALRPTATSTPLPASIIAASKSESSGEEPHEDDRLAESNFTQTDVLLADALTEMIGLKTELYHLRSKLESLNREVARLSDTPPSPKPPAAMRPQVFKKAA